MALQQACNAIISDSPATLTISARALAVPRLLALTNHVLCNTRRVSDGYALPKRGLKIGRLATTAWEEENEDQDGGGASGDGSGVASTSARTLLLSCDCAAACKPVVQTLVEF